jgi:hypothetical protein
MVSVSKNSQLALCAAALLVLNTAAAQSLQNTPIKTQEQAIHANANFRVATRDISEGPLTMLTFAETVASGLTGNSPIALPVPPTRPPKGHHHQVGKHKSRHSTDTLARAFQWIKNSGFTTSQVTLQCQNGGQYTAQLAPADARSNQLLMTASYAACVTDYPQGYSSQLDGQVAVRFKIGRTGQVNVTSVKFGKDYLLPTASDYIEKITIQTSPPQVTYRKMNYEVTGTFMDITDAGTGNGAKYYSDGPFSYRYNGTFTESFDAMQLSSVPTPIITRLTADNIVSYGSYTRRLSTEDKSYFQIHHQQGTYRKLHKSDFENGEAVYALRDFELTNKTQPVSIDGVLRDWTARGTVTVTNPPASAACGNGTFYFQTTRMTTDGIVKGQVEINRNVKVTYDDYGTWLSIDRGPQFSGDVSINGC